MSNRILVLPSLMIAVLGSTLLLPVFGQVLKESEPTLDVTQNSAKSGDIFEGVVFRESGNELLLDTTPCAGVSEKEIVAFVVPFTKTKIPKPKTCGKKTFTLVRVEKK